MVTYGLHISVGLRLWGMSVIVLLMMCETRDEVMSMMNTVNLEFIYNLFSILLSVDIPSLGMRVNVLPSHGAISADGSRLFKIYFTNCSINKNFFDISEGLWYNFLIMGENLVLERQI